MSLEWRTPVLEFANVGVSYRSLRAVEDVCLTVYSGECVCIVGENGSGKSSLIKGALGIVPASGTVRFNLPREKVSYAPQSGGMAKEDFPATVHEVVSTGRQVPGRFLPFYDDADRKAARYAMELLDIDELADRRIAELSGGQMQRVVLARALCSEPSLLILDEPFAWLDEETAARFASLIDSLNKNEGLTVLMVTHEVRFVRNCAHRIAFMEGRLAFCGTMAEWDELRKRGPER